MRFLSKQKSILIWPDFRGSFEFLTIKVSCISKFYSKSFDPF
jgi:hypothetical protein